MMKQYKSKIVMILIMGIMMGLLNCSMLAPYFRAYRLNDTDADIWQNVYIHFVSPAEPQLSSLVELIVFHFPLLLILYVISDVLPADLGRSGVYIFTRNSSRKHWYMLKCCILVTITLAYYSIYTITFFVFSMILIGKFVPLPYYLVRVIIQFIIFNALLGNAFALISNIVGIKYGSHIGMATCYILLFLSITMSVLSYYEQEGGWMYLSFLLNPISNAMIGWHANRLEGSMLDINISINQLTVAFSLIYYAVLNIILAGCGLIMIAKMDICLEDREGN